MVTTAYCRSSLELRLELTRADLPHDWLLGANDSLITRIRNEMTRSFLATDHTHMFWIDADIEFSVEDIQKVYNMDADVGVGVYAMKKRDQQQYAAWKDGGLITNLDQFEGPIEVDYAGTGFMCIRRNVIEKLTEIHGTYDGAWGKTPVLYMTPVTEGTFAGVEGRFMESEDYYFCRIARESGFKIMMDPSVRLGHWGTFRYGA